jgi:hypothetical protein
LYAFLIDPMRATFPAHLTPWFDHFNNWKYNLRSSLWNFLQHTVSCEILNDTFKKS